MMRNKKEAGWHTQATSSLEKQGSSSSFITKQPKQHQLPANASAEGYHPSTIHGRRFFQGINHHGID
jgi:hypothetical protein